MDLFQTIEARRSIRRYTNEPVPDEVVERAIDAALLAPNSSNTQTWDFYWVKSPEKKARLVKYCLNQSAARKAQQLIVITADPKKWKRSQAHLVKYVKDVQAPKSVIAYYEKLIPFSYRWGFLNSLGLVKGFFAFLLGFFRPVPRPSIGRAEHQLVAVKSAALACENFVLAIKAQGFDSCMMEGFDENRVKSMLNLGHSARVVMIISVGRGDTDGTWGPRFRIPRELVVHTV